MYRSVLIIKLSSDKGPLIVLMTHNLQAAVLQREKLSPNMARVKWQWQPYDGVTPLQFN